MKLLISFFLGVFFLLISCKKQTPKEMVQEIESRETFQSNDAIHFSDTTQTIFSQLVVKDDISKEKIISDVKTFYQQNGYKTRWLYEREPSPLFYNYLEVLNHSQNYGLNPETYNKQKFTRDIDSLYKTTPSPVQIETFDRNITASFLLLTHHLANGRISNFTHQKHTWKHYPIFRDDIQLLLKLKENDDLVKIIEALHPQHPIYKRMSDKYFSLQKDTIELVENITIKDIKQFKIGYKDSAVIKLRNNLKVFGYDCKPAVSAEIVDSLLMTCIGEFQKEKGIKSNGIPDPKTLYHLNMTFQQQRELLLLNMERMRCFNNDLGEDYLLVNVPEYKLYMYHKDSVVFESNIIVGAQYTATPIFIDTIKYVEFRPTWTVPFSISRREMIPKIIAEKNPLKYANRGYKIYENKQEIDPSTIDWNNPNVYKRALYFVESPSERNSLGLVKFILTNDMSIYLHDTASPRFFKREERALSHGCIRVEKPADLAYHLLKNQDDWNLDKVQDAMQNGKDKYRIRLKTKYLTNILYITTWVDRDNKLIIKDDIYGFDKEQLKELYKFM